MTKRAQRSVEAKVFLYCTNRAGGGQVISPCLSPGRARSLVEGSPYTRDTSTLSMRNPSMSTTSKR